jgi:hypothetical protein
MANNLGYITKNEGSIIPSALSSLVGPSTNVVGAAASPVSMTAGTGGYNTTLTAGSGGSISLAAAAGGATTSTGTGGSGGASVISAGAGGVSTAGTGGAGGVVYVRGGAGAASNGAGGSIILQPGLYSGTGAAAGVVDRLNGVSNTVAVGAAASVANVLSGFMTITGGAGNVTLPAGASITAAIPGCVVGDMFKLTVLKTAVGAATLVAGAGMTVKGAGTITAAGPSNTLGAEIIFVRAAAADWWVYAIEST